MADTLLGQVLDGRYRLLEILSDAGPRGVVYRAEHLRLDRTFAVKVFRGVPGPAFEEQARKLSCIRHPNVEPIHDYGRLHDGRPYLVTEQQAGESLLERMERPFDQLEVLEMLRHACAGLAQVHAADLVHGSIKPENIFFESHRSGEQLRLVDFDIVSGRTAPTFIDDVALASAPWISPEQAKGLRAEPASDLYALGAIAYACLAERPPHSGEPHAVLSKKIEAPAPSLRTTSVEVDEDVEALIVSMIEPEPPMRPESAAWVAEQADALHSELSMPAMPPQTGSHVPWFGLAATLMGVAALIVAEMRVASVAPQAMMPATGRVTLESYPSGAQIYLDGEALLTFDGRPAVTPADVQSLIYGERYRVQLRMGGYVTWETEVEMSRAVDGRYYRTDLSPLPSATPQVGDPVRLTVSGNSQADVYLDQHWIGSPPLVQELIPPGHHRLTIKSATEVRNLIIEAEPGDSIRYHVE